MNNLILAGGLGTRLQSVLKMCPKPMAPVGGRPFLEFLILQLRKWGMQDIILCTGYLGNQIKEYFGDGKTWGIRIRYSEEDKPLGTGGAIKLASRFIEEECFLVMNGDSLLEVDLNAFIAYHYSRQALATMALVKIDDTSHFGKVDISPKGEIVRFVEKGMSGSGLINGGIYIFNRKVLERIPADTISLEREVLPHLIGQRFYGMPVKGFFIDIGIPKNYKRLLSQPEVLSRIVEDCNKCNFS